MYVVDEGLRVGVKGFGGEESIVIGFGVNVCGVNVLEIEGDEGFGREKE